LAPLQRAFCALAVRDAVGDRATSPHETNLFDLQAKYAEFVGLKGAQDYLASLGADSAGRRAGIHGQGLEEEAALQSRLRSAAPSQ
jgi:hypothetical protein